MSMEKNKRIEEILTGLDGVQRAAAPDFFYTRLRARMEKAVEPLATRKRVLYPVYALAAVMTFRTPDEAATIANHTRYGLAATIWSENINLALDTAARMKAGVVWINSTNLFDAAAGFGG